MCAAQVAALEWEEKEDDTKSRCCMRTSSLQVLSFLSFELKAKSYIYISIYISISSSISIYFIIISIQWARSSKTKWVDHKYSTLKQRQSIVWGEGNSPHVLRPLYIAEVLRSDASRQNRLGQQTKGQLWRIHPNPILPPQPRGGEAGTSLVNHTVR